MIEERHIELIHAELDGELTEEQRAELGRVVRDNPEASTLREEMTRLFGALDEVKDVEPPADLGRSVLQALDRKAAQQPYTRRSALQSIPMPLRYAAMFAAGVLASAIVLQVGPDERSLPKVSELVGTMGGPEHAAEARPIDRIALELAQVSGSATTYAAQSGIVLELDLKVREPVVIVAAQDGRSVNFKVDPSSNAAPERLFWVADASGSPLQLKVFSSETLLYEGALQSSRSDGSQE